MMRFIISLLVCFVLAAGSSPEAVAQKKPPARAAKKNPKVPVVEEAAAVPQLSEGEKQARRLPFRYSLFFSAEDLLQLDRAGKGITSIPNKGGSEKIPRVRKIRLAGIIYYSPSKWMVFMNGLKVTPWVQPEEIKKIEVHPGWIDLEWFDIGANQVLRLEMPANSEYDIVTGVLLSDPTPMATDVKTRGRGRKR